MAPRIPRRALTGWVPRRRPAASRRLFSSAGEQTRFSCFLPAQDHENDAQLLFAKLRDCELLANPNGHDAAVVLATPNFARQLESGQFVASLARLLSGSADAGQFHVLCAVVDHLAPALGEAGAVKGISVLRGRLDDTLPELWLPSPPRAREDADAVSALALDLGGPRITLPLTRTTFHNSRASTLLTSRFDMTQDGPQLAQAGETHSQRITISLKRPPQSVADLGLWAPLSPVTRARVVTESFGNIIRGVEVEGKTAPASMELEDAVDTIFKHRSATETAPGPMGVWAMITPKTHQTGAGDALDPTPILQDKPLGRDAVEVTAEHLHQLYKSGGRLYKILSGGGGWGPKKGLLSLDAQRTHFAPSEEDEMARFMLAMEGAGLAPPGSQIQFFVAAPASPEDTACSASGIVFGVPGRAETAEAEIAGSGYLVNGHFGALSSQGVFVAGPASPGAVAVDESKMSVPDSRVYVGSGGKPTLGRILGFLGAGGLADAATATVL